MSTVYRVPTTGASLFITDPGEIIIYQIRHYLATARSASDVYYDSIRSYMDTYSRSGHDRDLFRSEVEADMKYIFKTIFYNDTAGLSVTITTTDVTGSPNTYNVVFMITITINNVLYSVSPEVYISNGVPVIRNDNVSSMPLTASTFT